MCSHHHHGKHDHSHHHDNTYLDTIPEDNDDDTKQFRQEWQTRKIQQQRREHYHAKPKAPNTINMTFFVDIFIFPLSFSFYLHDLFLTFDVTLIYSDYFEA